MLHFPAAEIFFQRPLPAVVRGFTKLLDRSKIATPILKLTYTALQIRQSLRTHRPSRQPGSGDAPQSSSHQHRKLSSITFFAGWNLPLTLLMLIATYTCSDPNYISSLVAGKISDESRIFLNSYPPAV